MKKLSTKDRIEISSSEKSSRQLEKKYNCDHSTIANIRKEGKGVLSKYWDEKVIGRPKKLSKDDEYLFKIKSLEKELEDKEIEKNLRVEFFKLQLMLAENKETLKKKLLRKEKLVGMYDEHIKKYPYFDNSLRLNCIGVNKSEMQYMKNHLKERKARESTIEQEDINNMINTILIHPTLGGHKGSLVMLKNQTGLISPGFYQEAKKELGKIISDEIFTDKNKTQLEMNTKKRKKGKEKFQPKTPTHIHEVWATDYTEISFFGTNFSIAEIYELYSQAYLGVTVDFCSSTKSAKKALTNAIEYSDGIKPEVLLSDNGGQFLGEEYQQLLKNVSIKHTRTPSGSPWYNGALESGNTNLKKTIYCVAAFLACENPSISKSGVSPNELLECLKICITVAMQMINEEIPRPKFKTTPANVLKGLIDIKNKEMQEYTQRKRVQRRMNKNKKGGTFKEKIKKGWRMISKKISKERRFAVGELLNNRFEFLAI